MLCQQNDIIGGAGEGGGLVTVWRDTIDKRGGGAAGVLAKLLV